MTDSELKALQDAERALILSNSSLRNAFGIWEETITQMHLAEIKLRDAQRTVVEAMAGLARSINGFATEHKNPGN